MFLIIWVLLTNALRTLVRRSINRKKFFKITLGNGKRVSGAYTIKVE